MNELKLTNQNSNLPKPQAEVSSLSGLSRSDQFILLNQQVNAEYQRIRNTERTNGNEPIQKLELKNEINLDKN